MTTPGPGKNRQPESSILLVHDLADPGVKGSVLRRCDDRVEKARETLVEIGAAKRNQAAGAGYFGAGDAGFPELGQMIAEIGPGAEIEELAAIHRHAFVAGEIADDGQPRLVAENGQHIGKVDLVDRGVRQDHGSKVKAFRA
jgi:hypothetical protein